MWNSHAPARQFSLQRRKVRTVAIDKRQARALLEICEGNAQDRMIAESSLRFTRTKGKCRSSSRTERERHSQGLTGT